MNLSRLTKRLFEKDPSRVNLFGLSFGQMVGCTNQVFANVAWFNQSGERIGQGDLSRENVERIADELLEDELFFVLAQSYARYDQITVEDLIENASFLIIKGKYFHLTFDRKTKSYSSGGLEFPSINRNELRKILKIGAGS